MEAIIAAGNASESNIQIDISKLSNAMYVIQFLHVNQSIKFIKQ